LIIALEIVDVRSVELGGRDGKGIKGEILTFKIDHTATTYSSSKLSPNEKNVMGCSGRKEIIVELQAKFICVAYSYKFSVCSQCT